MEALTFKDKQKTVFKRIKTLRELATPSELIFKQKLDELNIYYKFQKAFIQGDYYCIVDFYLPRPHKICIEIDGEYHSNNYQQKKDIAKDKYLNDRGLRVIRIKNSEASQANIIKLINQ